MVVKIMRMTAIACNVTLIRFYRKVKDSVSIYNLNKVALHMTGVESMMTFANVVPAIMKRL